MDRVHPRMSAREPGPVAGGGPQDQAAAQATCGGVEWADRHCWSWVCSSTDRFTGDAVRGMCIDLPSDVRYVYIFTGHHTRGTAVGHWWRGMALLPLAF